MLIIMHILTLIKKLITKILNLKLAIMLEEIFVIKEVKIQFHGHMFIMRKLLEHFMKKTAKSKPTKI